MTAILAVLDAGASVPTDRAFRAALGCVAGPAGDSVGIHLQPGVALGIRQASVAQSTSHAICTGFAVDDDYVVLVDGSLYYLDDLRRTLDYRHGTSATTGQLVLAAFRAFGAACVEKLEGDFAFLVWNKRTREVFCARDFTGRRPLYLAEWRDGLVVATSLDSIATLPGFAPRINVGAVGADAAGLFFALDDETCMRGVRSLRSGCTVQWKPHGRIRGARVWHPQPASASNMPFDEAASTLRDLLARAVAERMSESGPTAVWMSGGRDSPAVYAAGMHSMSRMGGARYLVPVSRSHPPNDSGREDEAIEEITRFWHAKANWVDAQAVPLFPGLRHRDRWSSESFAQPFEGLARALAKAGKSLGASIALDGYGGDFLFQVSPVYLADLVSRLKMARAVSDWRAMDRGREGVPGFVRYGVQPLLPRWAKRTLRVTRGGRAAPASMQRTAPPWITGQFEREHSLAERFAALGPDSQRGPTAVDREAQFYLTHQFFARINSRMSGFALDHGVELRSPLLDARVVRFALSRPSAERNNAGDNKRLLRASMQGLLPDSALAPRVGKSGTLRTYFAQHMWNDGLGRLTAMLPARELAELGVVNSVELSGAVEQYRSQGAGYPHVESLFCTLNAEMWLRARNAAVEECEPARTSVGSA